MSRIAPSHLAILGLLLIGLLLVRMSMLWLVYEAHPGRTFAQDSRSYERLALSIKDKREFTVSAGDTAYPDAIRTPGYPLFIAGIYSLFGEERFWVLAIQVVISALTLLPVYWMGASIWSPAVGLAAGCIYSLDYISLLASQMLLTDSLYVFGLTLAAAFGVATLMAVKRVRLLALLFGAALAAATLIRPVSFYLIVPVVAGFAYVFWRRSGARFAIVLALMILLPWVTLVGGWQLRNAMVAETTEISLIKGINLMRYRGAFIIAQRDSLDLGQAREVLQEEIAGLEQMTPAEQSAAFTKKTLELMAQYPAYAIAGQVTGTAQLMLVPGEAELLRYLGASPPVSGVLGDVYRLSWADFKNKWLRDNGWYLAAFVLALGYLVFLYVGSAMTLFNWERSSMAQVYSQVFLLGIAIYFALVSGGPEGYPRLRMPLMPFLALFAAAGWMQLLAHKKLNTA